MVELYKSIPKTVICACQFLPKNYVRVTFKDEASRDLALVKGASVHGFGLADHQARSSTNAWNVGPPPPAPAAPAAPAVPVVPNPYPPAVSGPPPSVPLTSGLPAPPAAPPPVPSAGVGSGLPLPSPAPGQHSAPGAGSASSQAPLQTPSLGLPLVPDSPLPFSGMPPLESLPGDSVVPSPAGVLDQQGFLVNQPSHPGASVPNASLPSSNIPTFSSTFTLDFSISNVGGQKSPAISNSSMVSQSAAPLTYSGVVGQIPNSNSKPPNSNLSNSSPSNSNSFV